MFITFFKIVQEQIYMCIYRYREQDKTYVKILTNVESGKGYISFYCMYYSSHFSTFLNFFIIKSRKGKETCQPNDSFVIRHL